MPSTLTANEERKMILLFFWFSFSVYCLFISLCVYVCVCACLWVWVRVCTCLCTCVCGECIPNRHVCISEGLLCWSEQAQACSGFSNSLDRRREHLGRH